MSKTGRDISIKCTVPNKYQSKNKTIITETRLFLSKLIHLFFFYIWVININGIRCGKCSVKLLNVY